MIHATSRSSAGSADVMVNDVPPTLADISSAAGAAMVPEFWALGQIRLDPVTAVVFTVTVPPTSVAIPMRASVPSATSTPLPGVSICKLTPMASMSPGELDDFCNVRFLPNTNSASASLALAPAIVRWHPFFVVFPPVRSVILPVAAVPTKSASVSSWKSPKPSGRLNCDARAGAASERMAVVETPLTSVNVTCSLGLSNGVTSSLSVALLVMPLWTKGITSVPSSGLA